GVLAVVTAKDLGSLRPLPFMATLPGLKQVPCAYLAGTVVNATGVPVAAVVAESASQARDAADLIEVEYEPLPPIADPERGLAPGAPLANADLGTNQAFSWPLKGGDVDGAFAKAAHVVKVRLDHNRLAGAPMEPRGVLARYDAASEELTLWLTTQNPFLSRADLGAHLLSLSLVPPMSASTHIFGPYRIQNAELLSVGVYTNTAPTGPYRGSGRPVGVYLIERVMDEAARATGLDPVEIRRRNFIAADAFPHRTPFGVAYDSGNYARALDRVLELADYAGLRREQAAARSRGELMGIGVATYVESTNVLGWESGVVRVERSGKVTAITGSSLHGQGHETTFAQIIADHLGVPFEDVVLR